MYLQLLTPTGNSKKKTDFFQQTPIYDLLDTTPDALLNTVELQKTCVQNNANLTTKILLTARTVLEC